MYSTIYYKPFFVEIPENNYYYNIIIVNYSALPHTAHILWNPHTL